jgi:signal peptidase I
MKIILECTITLLVVAVLILGLQLSLKAFEVFDVSMQPAFQEGDFILVNRLSYLFEAPRQGDLIAFCSPGSGHQLLTNPFFPEYSTQYIKRIIALPGDTVEIKDQTVLVNSQRLAEPYLQEPPQYSFAEITVPAGSYFVLGDNRNCSDDSHRGWFVQSEDVIGKIWCCYWTYAFPDIRIAAIPFLMIIIGIFSQEVTSKTKRSHAKYCG